MLYEDEPLGHALARGCFEGRHDATTELRHGRVVCRHDPTRGIPVDRDRFVHRMKFGWDILSRTRQGEAHARAQGATVDGHEIDAKLRLRGKCFRSDN